MTKLTAVAFFLLAVVFGAQSIAQETQPQERFYFTRSACDYAPEMMTLVTEKYGEELLFFGDGVTFEARSGQMMTGGLFFFTNQDTGTFSVMQIFGDGIGCMLMTGKNFAPYSGGPTQ